MTIADALATALDYQRSARPGEAETIYRRLLAADPDQASALYLCGVLTLEAGRPVEAICLLERAVACRPGHREARFALANARHHTGDAAGAIALWRGLLAEMHEGAVLNLARTLRQAGDLNGAIAACHSVLVRDTTLGRVWAELAAALLAAGEAADAAEAAAAALACDPGLAEAWFLRGTALSRQGLAEAAVAALGRAVTAAPDHAQAHLNLANALTDLDRLELAEGQLRRAIALDPGLVEAHASLGFLLTCRGRLAEAIEACRAALRIDPDFAPAHWNQATAHLLAGEFGPGWEQYEWRKQHARFAAAFWRFETPPWQGESLRGRTILVLAEQGLGDTIMCSRYIPLLASRGARVVLLCPAALFPLFRDLPGIAALVERGDLRLGELVAKRGALPAHDTWIDQMSLPRVFATSADSIPSPDGYLSARPERVAAWRERLPAGRKVGLVWAGNPEHSNDARRSMKLEMLRPILEVPGPHFISLQVGSRGSEAARWPAMLDVAADLTDYGETAACIAALDLVITVDTSVCHLAGALGRPVWVMLPYAPEWRWMIGRDDSPWYSSMRLFRQAAPGAWAPLAAEVADAFAAHALATWMPG